MKIKPESLPKLNFPSQTRFLLEFVNLGKVPGKLSPPTLEITETIKRKPDIEKPDFVKLRWWKLPNDRGSYTIDQNSNMWKRKREDKEPEWIGEADDFPKEEFYKLIFEKRLPITEGFSTHDQDLENFESKVRSADNGRISGMWYELRYCLFYVVRSKGDNYFCDEFLSEYLNELPRPNIVIESGQLKFKDDPLELYTKILAYFGDFYLSDKRLHSFLMHCPACGRFWIKKKIRSRPQIYCDPKCRKRFHNLSKEEKTELMRGYRDRDRKIRQIKEYKNLLRFLVKEQYYDDDNEAKKVASEWALKEGKTFAQYKKCWGL